MFPEVNVSIVLSANFVTGPKLLRISHSPFRHLEQILSSVDPVSEGMVSLLQESWNDFSSAVHQHLHMDGLPSPISCDELFFTLTCFNMRVKTTKLHFGQETKEHIRSNSVGWKEETRVWVEIEDIMYYFLTKAIQDFEHSKQGSLVDHEKNLTETGSAMESKREVPVHHEFILAHL